MSIVNKYPSKLYKQFDIKSVKHVEEFMCAFNVFLEVQIKKLGGNTNEDWYHIKDYT